MRSALIAPALALGIILATCGPTSPYSGPPPTPALPPPGQQPGTAPQASPSPNLVQITINIQKGAAGLGSEAYGPNPLLVPVGAQVTWVNQDTVPHTATALDGRWDSGVLQPAQSYSHVFPTAGYFSYYCQVHGPQAMSGALRVTSTPASPSP